MDLMLPPWIRVAEAEWRLVDFTGRSQTTLSGAQKRVSRGQRLACSLRFQNLDAEQRHALMAWVAALRGGFGTAILYDPANRQRGSFPGTEMFSNGTFQNGTTGWSTQNASLSVSQGVARTTGVAGIGVSPGIFQGPTLTQYAPHALRSVIMDGAGSSALTVGRYANLGSSASANDFSASRGLGTLAFVPNAASPGSQYPFIISAAAGFALGATWFSIPYASLQRCGLVDNSPNALTYSDQFDNAAWTGGGVTVSANSASQSDPFGTTTAEKLTEDGTTGAHYRIHSGPSVASEADYCGVLYARRDNLARDVCLILGTTGTGNYAQAYFDLNAGGVLGSSTAGTAANVRTFVVPLGNSWFAVFIVARLPTAAVRADLQVMMVSGGTVTYTGSTGSIMVMRGAVAQSSVPFEPGLTTSAADTGGGSAGVGSIYVKGLPVSTAGLVLAGDRVEINGEMKIATASLDSDAAGRGVLYFEPVLRAAPADNAPVIIGQPTGRFVLAEDASWQTRPGMFSDFALPFVEA